jgi:hypothetical protein
MKIARILMIMLIGTAASLPAAAAPSADVEAAIRKAALDYLEGWYEGDAARVERALHPDLVKRRVETHGGSGRLVEMTAASLVGVSRTGAGRKTPQERRRSEVRILDVVNDSATIRVDAADWIDFIHLVRWNGEWKIVNVLWEWRARK